MKAQSIGKQLKKGSSTLEIMMAFALLALALSGVIGVVFSNQSISIDTQTNTEALARASTMLEEARALGKENFSAVAALAPASDDIYQKSLTVEDLSAELKRITSIVSWSSLGRNLSITLTTLLTNPTVANSCSPTPTGNWKSPQHWDFTTSSLLPGNNSNGLGIADMKVFKGKLYVAASTPDNSDHTLHIFDLPQYPNQPPVYSGSVDNNTSSNDGLNAVALGATGANIYAFAANAHDANFATCSQGQSCSQLQVFDVTSGTPVIKYSLKLPGVLGSGGQAIGKSLYINGNYLYLGLTKTANGQEFNIIDISNPLLPNRVGKYTVGHTVNALYVKGNYAYLTTTDNAGGNKQLLVLDISDKTNPHLTPSPVGGFLTVAGIGVGNAIEVSGTRAYFGRSYSSAATPNFYILNNSNPATYPSQLPVIKSMTVGSTESVRSISVRGTLAFLMTGSQFQVWDLTDETNPKPWTPGGTSGEFLSLSSLGGTGTSFNCSSNYFYTAVASSQGNNKDIISIIGPGVIAQTITVDTPSPASAANNSNFTVAASASSGLPVTVSVSGVCTVSGNTVTMNSGTGTCTVAYNQAGNYQYGAAPTISETVTATKANQMITVNTHAPASAAHNSTFNVAASASSGLTVAITVTGSCSISGGTVTMTASTGSCVVHYKQAGNSNYNAATEVTETTAATAAPQAFDYQLSAPNITISKGSSKVETITVTKTAGATTQAVTVTLTNLPNKSSVTTTNPLSCTPNNICTLTFTIAVQNNNGAQSGAVTVQATTPGGPTRSITFQLTVN